MEALQVLIDRLNINYPNGKPISDVNSALLAEADAMAATLGQKIFIGVDNLWYFIDAQKFPNGKTA